MGAVLLDKVTNNDPARCIVLSPRKVEVFFSSHTLEAVAVRHIIRGISPQVHCFHFAVRYKNSRRFKLLSRIPTKSNTT
jgi:hypothetical protein